MSDCLLVNKLRLEVSCFIMIISRGINIISSQERCNKFEMTHANMGYGDKNVIVCQLGIISLTRLHPASLISIVAKEWEEFLDTSSVKSLPDFGW